MEQAISLPITNAAGYYEIRLESIGGLGANLCGKLLGELGAMYLGLNAASFSSYGSEKRGSPVKSYIRWCRPGKELRINSPVQTPHLLGIFHDRMVGSHPVMAGVNEECRIVVNTDCSAEEIRKEMNLYAGEVFCVDCQKIAMETKSRINMIMLGALVKAMGFVPIEAAELLVRDTLGKKYPDVLEKNVAGLKRGYKEAQGVWIEADPQYQQKSFEEPQSKWGYLNAPIGGINPCIGSTAGNDLSASREGFIPLFHPEKCIHCGLCDSTCPDMVFQFEEGEYKGRQVLKNTGLDYHYCKGCLRCVEVCPTEALTAEREREFIEKPYFVHSKDLLIKHPDYQTVGANSWVTSEAYLDEKRVDGGLV